MEYYYANREKIKAKREIWRSKNKEKIETQRKKYLSNPKNRLRNKINAKSWRDNLKKIVYNHYGNSCACCGESNSIFLSIDHKNNDGSTHRKQVKPFQKASGCMYLWIINHNFPTDLQLLCYNCNRGKHYNKGICPHKIGENH